MNSARAVSSWLTALPIILAGLIASCGEQPRPRDFEQLTPAATDYLGQSTPGETPELFAPGLAVDMAYSPDGSRLLGGCRDHRADASLKCLSQIDFQA